MRRILKTSWFVLKIPLWFLAIGGTWGICFWAVDRWKLYNIQPIWLVASGIIVASSIGQLLAMAAVDMFGDRKRSRIPDGYTIS